MGGRVKEREGGGEGEDERGTEWEGTRKGENGEREGGSEGEGGGEGARERARARESRVRESEPSESESERATERERESERGRAWARAQSSARAPAAHDRHDVGEGEASHRRPRQPLQQPHPPGVGPFPARFPVSLSLHKTKPADLMYIQH